ncbi:methyltransferase family protein [Halarchaeum salinum]|uniref:Isoprenylcysteine carboxylmethyltransferase family protein n=1 Tax=Halarchaeum salinum TaxID=489912 RepID=A0AAV3SA85_9EURY
MVTPYPLVSGPAALAFWTVYAVAFGPDLVRTLREDDPDPDAVRDAGSKYVIAACNAGSYGLAVLLAVGVPAATIRPARTAVFVCGLGVTLVGAALRWYAIRALADAFHGTVHVERDQSVVEVGPYRWVRHPSYTGGILMFLGIALALTNWLSLLAVCVGVAVGYGYRIRIEERALRATLGDAYAAYAERTSYRLVPYVY